MKIIKAGFEIIRPNMETTDARDAIYQLIERAGRTCYKSEDRITPESARKFVTGLIQRGHEAMLEHASMTVRFTVDRGVSHEIVRHRLASFAQESTRYCNYGQEKFGKEITVIEPCWFSDIDEDRKDEIIHVPFIDLQNSGEFTEREVQYVLWWFGVKMAEEAYFYLLDFGETPQEARSVLPNSLKTELVVTANMREWRHFFKLRAAGMTGKPHPQMAEVAVPLLKKCQEYMPELFGDIVVPQED